MAWYRTGDKPLSESMLVSFTGAYESLSLNEFKYFSMSEFAQGSDSLPPLLTVV